MIKELGLLGYNVDDCEAQIITLEAGAEQEVTRLHLALVRRSVFGSGFCPRASPKNRAFIRLTVNADLTVAELELVLSAEAEFRDGAGLATWPSSKRRFGLTRRVAAA